MNTQTLAPTRCAPLTPRPSASASPRGAPSPRQRVERLYREHHRSVRAFAQHLGMSVADADDVCSQVFLVALRRLESLRNELAPRTWLLGITRKVVADRRRSAAVRHEAPFVDVACERADDRARADEVLTGVERQRLLLGAVRELPAAQRQVVAAFALDERPMAAVAQGLGVPLQTAYARHYAGLRNLSARLSSFELLAA